MARVRARNGHALQREQFLLDSSILLATAPDGVPVFIRVCAGRGADDAEHPLCGVFVLAARVAAVADKVVDEGL